MTSLSVVHQLRARNGRGSVDAPNLLVLGNVPQRPPLYLLIGTLDADDQLTTQIAAACADAYRKARGSRTGALQAVIRAADTAVRQSGANVICGVSALLLAKDEALLAQVEPAVCWLLREGKLSRWPAESVWLDEATSEGVLARMNGGLGYGQVAPDLTRIPLQAADRLLLGTISVARQVGEFIIAQAMAQPDPSAALHDLVPDLDFAALSIEPNVVERVETTRRVVSTPSVISTPPVETQTSNGLAEYTSLIKRAPKTKAETAPPAATPSPESLAPDTQTPPTPPAFRAAPAADDDDGRPLSRRHDTGRSFRLPSLRPYFEVVVVTILFILRFVWMIFRSIVNLFARALPEREARPTAGRQTQARRPVMQSNPMESQVLVGLAVAIPILVLLAVVILRNQTASSQTSRFNELLAKANTSYQNALTMPSADAKKAELLNANQLTEDALKLSPGDKTAKELQDKLTNELDKLSSVTKFFFYPLLYEFKDKDSHPSAVIARGIDIYALDTGLNRLYKFLLNDTKDGLQPQPTRSGSTPAPTPNPIVMRQGDERGAIVIGRLADICWASAGGGRVGAGVLTLTAAKQVVEYLPTKGISVLALGAAPGWQEPTLGESFNGNLYVLDAKSNRILKYTPTGEDYKNAPSDYLAPTEKVDFAGAVDMAIDGFVYVLLADGTLMKFDSGHLIPFDKKGLETPLRKPVALVAQANSQSLWIADAGNKRIVQLSKNGDFVRQFKPDDPSVMSDLRGLAVDEPNRRFYFVNGNKLYMGTLQN